MKFGYATLFVLAVSASASAKEGPAPNAHIRCVARAMSTANDGKGSAPFAFQLPPGQASRVFSHVMAYGGLSEKIWFRLERWRGAPDREPGLGVSWGPDPEARGYTDALIEAGGFEDSYPLTDYDNEISRARLEVRCTLSKK